MDIQTMLFALALGNLTLCAALFFHQDEAPRPTHARLWAGARLCQGAAWLLLALGSPLDAALPLAGWALLFTGLASEAVALREAAGLAGRRRAFAVAVGLALGAVVAEFFIGSGHEAGLVATAGLYAAIAAAAGAGWRSAGRFERFLALSGVALAALVAAPELDVLLPHDSRPWLSSRTPLALSGCALYLLMLLGAFGYLLLERARVQGELSRMAVLDPLTGVPNRRGFFNALAPWMALARRPGQPTALMVLDIDLLKRINDGYGHPAGDTVLRAIVDTCSATLRDSDQLGRLGGAEFAVLLPRTGLPEAIAVAERIRVQVEASPVKTERALVNMTVSIGVTTLRPDDSNVSLFKRAGEALAGAKRAGRNKVVAAPAAPVAVQA